MLNQCILIDGAGHKFIVPRVKNKDGPIYSLPVRLNNIIRETGVKVVVFATTRGLDI